MTYTKPTFETIKKAIEKMSISGNINYIPMVYHEWPENLCSKTYDNIIGFIYKRFKVTTSVVEYYVCMIYLNKEIKEESLYVPFVDSLQYIRLLNGTENKKRKLAKINNKIDKPKLKIKDISF